MGRFLATGQLLFHSNMQEPSIARSSAICRAERKSANPISSFLPPLPALKNVFTVTWHDGCFGRAETRDLLRSRLRIVASLLFACFLAYIVRWVSHWSEWNDPIHHWLFSILGVVAVVLGLLTLALCHKSTSLADETAHCGDHGLRGSFTVLSGPALLYRVAGHLPSGGTRLSALFWAPWMLLIFTILCLSRILGSEQ